MAGQTQWHRVGANAADVYERHLVPAMFASWAPLLVEAADVRPGDRVLDVACGTGVVARLAAERVGSSGRVVGLDVNAAMLEVADSLPRSTGAGIEWCKASALTMPLRSEGFEVVLCQQGLQQFSDRAAALNEIRRVLQASGRLAACVWSRLERCQGMAALVEALARHVGDVAANNRRAPFSLGDANELGSIVSEAGFRDVAVRTLTGTARFPSAARFVEYQLAATPLSTLNGISDDAVAAVVSDVRAALQVHASQDGLTFPMEAHLVTARKP